jgi:hypothetical protein
MTARDILFGSDGGDTTLVELRRIAPSDGVAGDIFGHVVSIDSLGDYIVVGSPYAPIGANYNQGAVYIYYRSNGNYTQQAKLLASDGGADDHFGTSVSINSTGNILVVGSNFAAVGSNLYQGAAYVFTRSGTTWTQRAKLTASDGTANNFFGASVAINAVGNYIAITSYGSTSAYIYTGSGVTWTQQAKVTPSVVLVGQQNLALNSAGDYLVVTNSVYKRTGTTWALEQTIAAPIGSSIYFGWSTAINDTGDCIAISDWNSTATTITSAGAVYMYSRTGTTWTLQQKLNAIVPTTGDSFGYAVSMTPDANTIMIGAIGYDPLDPAINNAGSVYIFDKIGSTWTQQQILLAGNRVAGDGFGYTVDINSDRSTLVIGAPYTDSPVADRGTAYIFG